MPQFFSQLLTGIDADDYANNTSFWQDEQLTEFKFGPEQATQTLNSLNSKLLRNPNHLLTHLRRIYVCFQLQQAPQLYAALLDLLIVLQGKGKALSRRMLKACASKLDANQVLQLNTAIDQPHILAGNRYNLLSHALLGSGILLETRQLADNPQDALALAHDFIEYSQLEQAMHILETGISQQPERHDLQELLLELYLSTAERERFQHNYQTFLDAGIPLIDAWQSTATSLSINGLAS